MKATLNLEPGVDVQAWDAQLDDIAALALTNSNFIVGDGVNWVAESGETARTSMGAAGLTGNETIAGIKTFSSIPLLPASDPTTDNQATRKSYVDTAVEAGSSDAELTAIAGLTSAADKIINFTGEGTAELLDLSTFATLTGEQTLTNKTLTSPVLNTGVSGTAVLDEDDMDSDSATQLTTQQSQKAYIATQIATRELVQGISNLDSEGNVMLKSHAYLAVVDGYVSAIAETMDDDEYLKGYIHSTNNPAGAGTMLQEVESSDVVTAKSIYFAVPAGWYFEVTCDDTVVIYWQSYGTDSKPVDNN